MPKSLQNIWLYTSYICELIAQKSAQEKTHRHSTSLKQMNKETRKAPHSPISLWFYAICLESFCVIRNVLRLNYFNFFLNKRTYGLLFISWTCTDIPPQYRYFSELKHSVSIITNSGTTLCAQCPERKSELRVHQFKSCCPFPY